LKSATFSADDEESQIINTTCATKTPDMAGLIDVVELSKDHFLPSCFGFRLGTFGHDTFQLDIEPVDNRLPLSTIASDVDGFRANSQLEPSCSCLLR
jgi:hypothetical protein